MCYVICKGLRQWRGGNGNLWWVPRYSLCRFSFSFDFGMALPYGINVRLCKYVDMSCDLRLPWLMISFTINQNEHSSLCFSQPNPMLLSYMVGTNWRESTQVPTFTYYNFSHMFFFINQKRKQTLGHPAVSFDNLSQNVSTMKGKTGSFNTSIL